MNLYDRENRDMGFSTACCGAKKPVSFTTCQRIDLFVSTRGSDDYDGLSPLRPLRTPKAALDRVPIRVRHHVVIHLSSGVYEFPLIKGRELSASLAIIGDGAGQSDDDGFVELLSHRSAGEGSDETQISVVGLEKDQYQGKTIEILSGAAKGDRRTIRNNTETRVIPVNDFSGEVNKGDEFRVIESGIVFTVNSNVYAEFYDVYPKVLGAGYPGSVGNDGDSWDVMPAPGLVLINLRIESDAGWHGEPDPNTPVAFCRFVSSRVTCAGVEINSRSGYLNVAVTRDCEFLCGLDADFGYKAFEESRTPFSGFVDPFEMGFAQTKTSWTGWGLSIYDDDFFSPRQIDHLFGYVVVNSSGVQVSGGMWKLRGGAIRKFGEVINSSEGALVATSFQSMVIIQAATRKFLVECVGSSPSSAAISAWGGGAVALYNTEVSIFGRGVGVYAGGNSPTSRNKAILAPGQLSIAFNNTISAPDAVLAVGHGGKAYFDEIPEMPITPSIAEVAVFQSRPDTMPEASANFSDISNGQVIFNPGQNDGALVMRMT